MPVVKCLMSYKPLYCITGPLKKYTLWHNFSQNCRVELCELLAVIVDSSNVMFNSLWVWEEVSVHCQRRVMDGRAMGVGGGIHPISDSCNGWEYSKKIRSGGSLCVFSLPNSHMHTFGGVEISSQKVWMKQWNTWRKRQGLCDSCELVKWAPTCEWVGHMAATHMFVHLCDVFVF